mmetsp:Transcript_1287/g.2534  ORF Transcript_1287/g.2534 Transcript_1287/m.2534 type:complete len:256 (+) Transcript_1287:1144-1911(+)
MRCGAQRRCSLGTRRCARSRCTASSTAASTVACRRATPRRTRCSTASATEAPARCTSCWAGRRGRRRWCLRRRTPDRRSVRCCLPSTPSSRSGRRACASWGYTCWRRTRRTSGPSVRRRAPSSSTPRWRRGWRRRAPCWPTARWPSLSAPASTPMRLPTPSTRRWRAGRCASGCSQRSGCCSRRCPAMASTTSAIWPPGSSSMRRAWWCSMLREGPPPPQEESARALRDDGLHESLRRRVGVPDESGVCASRAEE